MNDKAVEVAGKMLGVIRAKHLAKLSSRRPSSTGPSSALKQDGDLRNTALEVLTRLANIKPVQVPHQAEQGTATLPCQSLLGGVRIDASVRRWATPAERRQPPLFSSMKPPPTEENR